MFGRAYFKKIALAFLDAFLHVGTSSLGAPQRALFKINDQEENFAKGPLFGIFPSSLLKDTLRYLRCKSASKDLG